MLIDTHCHIDLFDDPIATASAYHNSKTRCVMTTMIPSHYQVSLPYLKPYKLVMPAIGLHPLRVHEDKEEIKIFINYVNTTVYIGEIGLDFSFEGKKTKLKQINALKTILPLLKKNNKFVTVHSRNAHEELAQLLDDYHIGPVCFHYFIGGPQAAAALAVKGHFFSVNGKMLRNKHRNLIETVNKEHILVESDGPFLTKQPLKMIQYVYDALSSIWQTDKHITEEIISVNFEKCRTIATEK